MIAVLLGVPLMLLALLLLSAVWLVCNIFLAMQPRKRSGRRRQRRLPSAKIPGLYEPRWGAYRRGREARDKSQWDKDFRG